MATFGKKTALQETLRKTYNTIEDPHRYVV